MTPDREGAAVEARFEALADLLGAMPEASNIFDISDEATTVLNADVETIARAVIAAGWVPQSEVAERLEVVRLVERDMAEQALAAGRSADARRGLSDHAALEVHTDALTRWSERLRMALNGEDYRADRLAGGEQR